MTVHVTLELTDDEHERLSALAAFEGVDIPSLLLARKAQLLDDDDAFRAAVEEGRQAMRDGRFLDLDEAERQIRAELQGSLRP